MRIPSATERGQFGWTTIEHLLVGGAFAARKGCAVGSPQTNPYFNAVRVAQERVGSRDNFQYFVAVQLKFPYDSAIMLASAGNFVKAAKAIPGAVDPYPIDAAEPSPNVSFGLPGIPDYIESLEQLLTWAAKQYGDGLAESSENSALFSFIFNEENTITTAAGVILDPSFTISLSVPYDFQSWVRSESYLPALITRVVATSALKTQQSAGQFSIVSSSETIVEINQVSVGVIGISASTTIELENEYASAGLINILAQGTSELAGGNIEIIQASAGTVAVTGNSISEVAGGGNAVLLMKFNTATGITDEKGHAVTANGLVLNIANYKYGDASLQLNGGAALSITNSTDFDPGSQDFCTEMWYKHVSQAQYSPFLTRDGADYPLSIVLANVTSGKFYFAAGTNSGWFMELTAASAPSTTEFEHWAFTRNGNIWSIWRNGALDAQTTASGSIGVGGADPTIGGLPGHYVAGFLDSIRTTIGSPVYTDSFTPEQFI